MLKIRFIKKLVIFLFLLIPQLGKSQPKVRACSINLALEIDTSIQIANWALSDYGIVGIETAEKARLALVKRANSSKYISRIPIWDKNLISVSKDSVYADLLLTLVKNKDTMSIKMQNLLLDKRSCSLYYAIHYMPFIKGNFIVKINRPSDFCSYNGVYRKTELMFSDYGQNIWDITPEDWSAHKVD
jgi:uncharacterized protein with PQ loop repeat